MSLITVCQSCQAKIRITPEIVGKKIRCKTCSESFVAKVAESVPVPVPADEKPKAKLAVAKAVASVAPVAAQPKPKVVAEPVTSDEWEVVETAPKPISIKGSGEELLDDHDLPDEYRDQF